MKIKKIQAREILDSRGNPTIETEVVLSNGIKASASVPSGASKGYYEALELRDNDPKRYLGKGVLQAVKNVNEKIAPLLKGKKVNQQKKIDQFMLELDGTKNKANLGANSILSVSLAVCRAAAFANKKPLYEYLYHLFGWKKRKFVLPVLMFNVLNGGKHALGGVDFQEFMIIPLKAGSIAEGVRWAAEVFHYLGKIIKEHGWTTTVGDEGGYAPPLNSNEEPLKLLLNAIEKAGYEPGKEIGIALDPAASEFYENNYYYLKREGKKLSSQEMIEFYQKLTKKYPIFSIEDGLSENDWQGFREMTRKLGKKIQIVGDDLYVTNPLRLKRGIKEKSTNSILIKPNQIGTLSETIETVKLALKKGMTAVVSHRSGETEDSFIADFVVAAGNGQIKTGSLCRSERVAKYNRLLKIELELKHQAKIANFPFATI